MPLSRRGSVSLALLTCAVVALALPARAPAQCPLERIDVSDHQIQPDFTHLGETIGLSGDRLASGVFDEWVNLPGSRKPVIRGAVYVHRRVGGAWELEDRLFIEGFGTAQAYGYTVALDGGHLAVGVPGACVGDPVVGACPPGRVVMYALGSDGWEIAQIVQPDDPTTDDVFGEAIDLSGERMIVGAYAHTAVPIETPGAAYVFERVGGAWVQVAKLQGTSGDPFALFGMAVAIDGDVAAVAAPGEPTALGDTGALYVYERLGGVWTERARLELPHERGAYALARASVDVSGRRVFEPTPLGWAQTAKLFAPDALGAPPGIGDRGGFAVELDGGLLAFGAPTTPTGSLFETGAVYVAHASDIPCAGQSLSPATELLSMSEGGSQVLHVQAGAAQAGNLYVVLGSATGTEPGFALGFTHVPLVPDVYFDLTATVLGGPPFVAGLGTLDAQGAATARFDLPPGLVTDPAFFGFALHHAVLVRKPGVGFTLATNAVRLRLVP